MRRSQIIITLLTLMSVQVFFQARAHCAESPRAVVYVDSERPVSWVTRGAADEIGNFLQTLGFAAVGADGLSGWMTEKISAGAGDSLVVMAQDVVPDSVVGAEPGPDALIRKYLDAGGSVIWMADAPFYFVGEGEWDKRKWDYHGGRGVLGIDTVGNWRGRSEASAEGVGVKWGLQRKWTSTRAVKPGDVSRVLAVDADGAASAWIKKYSDSGTGFIRLWDTSITNFTDEMGEDLYRVVSNSISGFSENRNFASIYLFKPSDYRPLTRREGGGLVREIQVSIFNNAPGVKKYELRISHGGKTLETIMLFNANCSFYKKNIDLPLRYPDQKVTLALVRPGGDEIVKEVELDEKPFHFTLDWRAVPLRNPVDMGSVLVPTDKLLAGTDQRIRLSVSAARLRGGRKEKTRFQLRVVNREKDLLVDMQRDRWIAPGGLAEFDLEFDAAPLGAGKYRAELTVHAGDELIFSEKKWLLIRKPPVARKEFGAYRASLQYDGPVPIYDRETEKWSRRKWDELWRRGPSDDVVVAFPNGARFVWWRGSSNVPFWASAYNVGLTYEWLEGSFGRGGLVDCIEPLQDKECRYSRPKIVSSTSARAVIDWRYALIDLEYTIADEEWADETYTFYPDGFGVRKATGYLLPMNWHEANEFITFTPAGANPFDVLAPDAVHILSPNGLKKEIVTYPLPAGKWPEGEPAIFRVRWSKSDPSTPIMAVREFDHFIIQYDGWKVDGRYVSPSYWGVHYPVTRGYPTTRGAPPRWRENPAHASLMAIESAPLTRKYFTKKLEKITWVWLIGNTDARDGELIEFARNWISPVPLTILSGGRGGEYDPAQRGYVIESDSMDAVVAAQWNGAEDATIVNPVLILEGYTRENPKVLVDGVELGGDDYRFAVERDWTGARGVLWLNMKVTAKAKIELK